MFFVEGHIVKENRPYTTTNRHLEGRHWFLHSNPICLEYTDPKLYLKSKIWLEITQNFEVSVKVQHG